VGPRKKLNLMLGAMLGLFAGIAMAFAGEWWKQNGAKIRKAD